MFKANQKTSAAIALVALLSIFAFQWILFKGFVGREISWSPFLNGDANWYLGHSYIVFDSILKEGKVPDVFFNDPAGIMVLLASSILYFIFGASRLVALSTNFIPYLVMQGFIFYMARRLTESWIFAFAILGLILTMAVPFQIDTNQLLSFMEYQREFSVFCLFGIFITTVLFSDTFLNTKWSVISGLIAGLIISYRYNTLFHLVGIYSTIFTVFVFVIFCKRKDADFFPKYRKRFFNGILSIFFMSMACAYPIWRARYALYNHYFAGKLIGPKNESFIEIYQQGVKGLWQQIAYYPNFILNSGLGSLFLKTSAMFCLVLLCFFIALKIIRLYRYNNFEEIVINKNEFDAVIFYVFVFISALVPLFLLTAYPVRSANVGILVTAPFIVIVCVFLSQLYNTCTAHTPKKTLLFFTIGLASGTILLSAFYQTKCYSLVSFSSNHREAFLEVATLYDDIIATSKNSGNKTPAISVNFLENYVLGCGEAITAYQYEKKNELFRIQAVLGGDVGRSFTLDEASDLILASDLMLLDTSDPPQGTHLSGNYGMMSHNLAVYPFAKSMYLLRPEIRKLVENNFNLKGYYQIFHRKVELYENRRMAFKPQKIQSSSKLNEHHSAETILTATSTIWHSEPNPSYPQWLEFSYQVPIIINNISMICQIGAPDRGPSDFYFQGLDKMGNWINLIEVSGAGFKEGDEVKTWPIENNKAFKKYKLNVTKNNGSPNLLTIKQVIFGYLEDKGSFD
jgi:hypothetical protein